MVGGTVKNGSVGLGRGDAVGDGLGDGDGHGCEPRTFHA
jgi:hypothetical protein